MLRVRVSRKTEPEQALLQKWPLYSRVKAATTESCVIRAGRSFKPAAGVGSMTGNIAKGPLAARLELRRSTLEVLLFSAGLHQTNPTSFRALGHN